MTQYYKWIYKIQNKKDSYTYIDGEWITDIPASKICAWFESIGYETIELFRICKVHAEEVKKVEFNKDTFASVIVYKNVEGRDINNEKS